MKCEVCGEYISVVYEHTHATSTEGHIADCYVDIGPPLLRCGCYSSPYDGYPDCPYHIADGVVVRDEPPPPGPFDDHIRASALHDVLVDNIFVGTPVLDRLRGNEDGTDLAETAAEKETS